MKKNNTLFLVLGIVFCVIAFITMIAASNNYQSYIATNEVYKSDMTTFDTYYDSSELRSEMTYGGFTTFLQSEYAIYTDDDSSYFFIPEDFFSLFNQKEFEQNANSNDRITLYIIYETEYEENGEKYYSYCVGGVEIHYNNKDVTYLDYNDSLKMVAEIRLQQKITTLIFLCVSIVFVTAGIVFLSLRAKNIKKEKDLIDAKKKVYINDPTRFSSLSYYKTFHLDLSNVCIRNEFEEPFEIENPETLKYFRLCYRPKFDEVFEINTKIVNLSYAQFDKLAEAINACYDKQYLSVAKLDKMQASPVFDGSMWLGVKKDGMIIASLIGTYDKEIRESTIEWLQVHKDYRHQGLATDLIKRFLRTATRKSAVITVSGDMNNPNNPVELYEKCGFTDRVIWYITKK